MDTSNPWPWPRLSNWLLDLTLCSPSSFLTIIVFFSFFFFAIDFPQKRECANQLNKYHASINWMLTICQAPFLAQWTSTWSNWKFHFTSYINTLSFCEFEYDKAVLPEDLECWGQITWLCGHVEVLLPSFLFVWVKIMYPHGLQSFSFIRFAITNNSVPSSHHLRLSSPRGSLIYLVDYLDICFCDSKYSMFWVTTCFFQF